MRIEPNGDRRRPGDQVVRVRLPSERQPVVGATEEFRWRIPLRNSPLLIPISFAMAIVVGALLLLLPWATAAGNHTNLKTAFFTSTSAVTVTGLVIVESATHWTRFGQAIIMVLIVIGGTGFMTLATFALVVFGRRITLSERLLMRESLSTDQLGGLIRLTRNIVVVAAVITLEGTLLLFLFSGLRDRYPLPEAAWYALFHAVSAFNNAGFAIIPNSDSLTVFNNDYVFLSVIMGLIILGGIGFTVMVDLVHRKRFTRFSVDSRLVVVTSVVLWLMGGLLFLVSEMGNPSTLGRMSPKQAMANAAFQSVTTRTAGFNTVNMGAMNGDTWQLMDFLMFIGGGAGSAAGGIKVNTFAVILVAVLSSVRGRSYTQAFKHTIPHDVVQRALAVLSLSLLVVFATASLMTFTEGRRLPTSGFNAPPGEGLVKEEVSVVTFNQMLFETISAMGTVGLSTGITPQLTTASQVLLMLTMFLGRLGPLTLAITLTASGAMQQSYRFAGSRIRIG